MTGTQRYVIKMVWMLSVIMQGVMQGARELQNQQSGLSLPLGIDFITRMTVYPRIPFAASEKVGFSVSVNVMS